MSYRFFPSTSGPGASTAFGPGICQGLAFDVTSPGMVLQGYFFWRADSSQSASATFALWTITSSTTGTFISGSNVSTSSGVTGQWNFVPLATPLALTSGTAYMVVMGQTGNFSDTHPYFNSSGPAPSGITNGPLNLYADPGGTGNTTPNGNVQGSFTTGSSDPTITFPTSANTAYNPWIDVQVDFASAPVPQYAAPGRTWLRRFHHRQEPPAGVAVAPAPPVNGTVAPLIAVYRRLASQVSRAVTGSGAKGIRAPFPPPSGSAPGGTVSRRRPARAVAGSKGQPGSGTAAAPTVARAVTGSLVAQRAPSRRPRAVTAHVTGAPATSVTLGPAGSPPGGLVVRRQAPGGLWGGLASSRVISGPSPNGSKPGGSVSRRYPARAVTAHVTATARPNGSRPGGSVSRRPPARARTLGTVVRTANAAPLQGSLQPHPSVNRRRPARAVAAWIPVTTTNAPPPAFQVARSTPTVTAPDTSAASVTDPRDGTNTVTAIATSSPGVT